VTTPPVAFHRLEERAVYEEHDAVLDRRIWGRRIEPALDAGLVHHWMHQPHVVEFWQMAWPTSWVEDYLQRHAEDPHRTAYLGFVGDDPVGYVEVYDPAHDVLGQHYPVAPGDVGAHVLIGDEADLGRFSVSLGMACIRFLFRRPEVQRVVGEPDVRNHQLLSLLAFLGFHKQGEVDLPDKRAALMVCDRRDFERLRSGRRRLRTVR
jgi:acetyl CoA:N6-hydroxylysine acetyl transferase